MQAIAMLSRRLAEGCPQMHAARLRVLLVATAALMQHPRLSISALGRALPSRARPKHSIKRIDRLVGNRHLMQERVGVYQVLAHWLLKDLTEPVIVVDWSDATPDRRWQLLRAALPAGGRTLTLYEEVHPLKHLANRHIQYRFLRRLRTLLPAQARPILITDAGFRVPWFRAVERQNWHWIGRIRSRDQVRGRDDHEWWRCKLLYALALPEPHPLGEVELVRSHPIRCRLYLVHQPKQGRVKRTRYGRIAQSRHSQKNASREREPWLLAASRSLGERPARRIVDLYRQRMQIEEGFRDLKSAQYGLAWHDIQSHDRQRIQNLLLLAALALLALWLIGHAVRRTGRHRQYQSNTTKQPALSDIKLGLYALQRGEPPPIDQLRQSLKSLSNGQKE